ncbi:MAG: SPOR domain-containing protein [Steroidobacteraceae bacterium]
MMLTFRAGKVAVLALLLSLLAACSREQQDWRSAEAADTLEGYGQFLERHPDSELARQARTRVAQLSEDRAWQRAGSAATSDAYKQFLAQHPNGKWAQEARIRVQNFALAGLASHERAAAGSPGAAPVVTAAPSVAPAATAALASPGELASVPAYRETSPGEPARAPTSARASPGESPPAALPTQAAAATASTAPPQSSGDGSMGDSSTGYGVQLGAFTSESAAGTEWQQLTSRFGAQLRGLSPHVVPANTTTGRVFRLQVQVAAQSQARALCEVLRKQSQGCVPVLPH